MAFSSVTRPFLLARGRLATPIDAGAQKASKARGFLCLQCASHASPLMLLCVEPWGILEARRKRILTIFAPWTFLHTQGQGLSRATVFNALGICIRRQLDSCHGFGVGGHSD